MSRHAVELLSNASVMLRGSRIVPSIKDGKANGFKLYAIRPGSVYAAIGFMNGDTIHKINNIELVDADRTLEIYSRLKTASSWDISMTRRGKPMGILIHID